jgi:ABC-2 type transport system ATP-binding protein
MAAPDPAGVAPTATGARRAAPAIACKQLVKRYGSVVALDGLDLEVHVGECFGLLGPNGAGKTTTVEILEGLLEPTAGEVRILGQSWKTDERSLRQRLGISLQETHLSDRITVRETLRMFRSFYERGRSIDETLSLVALEEKRDAFYETLSGGQKQRLAVACALIGSPDLIVLDEPTTGLDPQSRRMLWDVIVRFKDEGGSVLLTTHYMDEAQRLCDRVGIVDHGKMIALGTPAELIASVGGEEMIEFEASPAPAMTALEALAGVQRARPVSGRLQLAADNLHETLPALLSLLREGGATLTYLATHRATLEDVFVVLTGRQLRD